jgi:excisionase family DNA binding protein
MQPHETKPPQGARVDTAPVSMKQNESPQRPAPALTVNEAARSINVSDRTVRSWIKNGTLQSFRIGGVVRIPSEAVLKLVEGRP